MTKRVCLSLMMAVAVIVISQFACGQQYNRVAMVGHSMEPNFSDGQVLKILEVPLSELKRGDLVLVENNGNLIVKRLIGLPNETVSIQDTKVYINGTLLVEPYDIIPPTYTVNELMLDSDSYFILGDNRPDSIDSHSFGPIKGSAIKGKATP